LIKWAEASMVFDHSNQDSWRTSSRDVPFHEYNINTNKCTYNILLYIKLH